MIDDVWRIHDKEWMKQRQQRWKSIQARLKQMLQFDLIYNKEDIRYHKAYFLKGKILPIEERWGHETFRFDKSLLGKPFPLRVFYRMWYYPELNRKLFGEWCAEASNLERYEYWRFLHVPNGNDEFFADRSPYIDEFLAPQTYQELVDIDKRARPQGKIWISRQDALRILLRRIQVGVSAHHLNLTVYRNSPYLIQNFTMCFAFPLLRELLVSVDDLSFIVEERRGNPNRGLQDCITVIMLGDKLRTIMDYLVNHEMPPEEFSWGVPAKLYRELTAFFEGGVTSEIDALWKSVKLKKIGAKLGNH